MSVEATPDQLQVSVESGTDEQVIHLAGELDPHTAPRLQVEIDRLLEAGASAIILDLSRLGFVDSSGLRVLIRAHQDVTRDGGRFAVRNPSPTARRLLEITGLTDLIESRS
jgi:anti-anti-sigma factor